MTGLAPERWIDRGKPLPSLGPDYFKGNLNLPFRYFALIQVRSVGNITQVRWDPAHADKASIDAAVQAIMQANAATTLVFYKSGWFKEHYSSASDAAARLLMVGIMGDVKISRSAFIKEQNCRFDRLPPLIKLMMRNRQMYHDYSIETAFDERRNWFPPTRSGRLSATAQVLGPDWITNGALHEEPQNKPADDEMVREYHGVLKSWAPRYDTALASLARDGEEPRWVPYHRVVLPRKTKRGGFGTSNLVALGNVDLAPLGSAQCVW